jgi:hypothetical protein
MLAFNRNDLQAALLTKRSGQAEPRKSPNSIASQSPSGGCGDLIAEREFPSDKVYRRDDRGIVGVESFSLQGLAFFVIHTGVVHGLL